MDEPSEAGNMEPRSHAPHTELSSSRPEKPQDEGSFHERRDGSINQEREISEEDSNQGKQNLRCQHCGLLTGCGREISTISAASLQPFESQVSRVNGADFICSYSLIDNKPEAIYVPGCPAQWNPLPLPAMLSPDILLVLKDHVAKEPKYPFEATFRAAEVMRPDFRCRDLDVLVTRETLQLLLDFCEGRGNLAIRHDLYIVDNTLVIEVSDHKVHESTRTRYSSFGRSFKHEFRISPVGIEDAESYHRLIRYKIGDLSCAVRFSVDAFFDDLPEAILSEGKSEDKTELLSGALGDLQLAVGQHVEDPPIRVIRRGYGILPQQCATLAADEKLRTAPFMARLWLDRAPFLFMGQHDKRGHFQDVEMFDMNEKLIEWEEKPANQTALRKMATLLSRLRDITKAAPGQSCALVYDRVLCGEALQVLEIIEPGKKPLPKDIVDKFW